MMIPSIALTEKLNIFWLEPGWEMCQHSIQQHSAIHVRTHQG